MIRQIKSLYDKTLARIVPPAGVDGKELDAAALVRRRVEITVERETVSVLVPSQPGTSTDQTAGEQSNLETQPLKLLPWPDTAPKSLNGITTTGKPEEAK